MVAQGVEHTGRICVLASEEDEEPVPVPGRPAGREVRAAVRSARRLVATSTSTSRSARSSRSTAASRPKGGPGTLEDCLQPGRTQVAAGYVIYGSSTMLVYTTGQGVHGFTLDPSIGEFLLSHPNIRTPEVGKYYCVNESYWDRWSRAGARGRGRVQDGLAGRDGEERALHRIAGRRLPPQPAPAASSCIRPTPRIPQGKLRLLYEAAPLALHRRAGGRRWPPTAAARSSTSCPKSCTSARRS